MEKVFNDSYARQFEEKLLKVIIPRIPRCLHTHHFTYLNLFCSFLIVFFSFKSRTNIVWLSGISLSIFIRWFADMTDGELGRQRGTGLIRWGYYVDHFFDYLFACSLSISFFLLFPSNYSLLSLIFLIVLGSFMTQSYIYQNINGRLINSFFKISPVEFEFALAFIFLATIKLNVMFLVKTIFIATLLLLFALYLVFYYNQKQAWKQDSPQF